MQKKNRFSKNVNETLVLFGVLIFLLALSALILRGYYNRLWADDWCYTADFVQKGFWGTLQGYLDQTRYASNRFSLTLFSGLFLPLGVQGAQLLPLLIIGLWAAGLYALLRNLVELLKFPYNKKQVLFAALILIYFALYLAPNQFQILYWRSGALPYTFPLIFTHFILLLITSSLLRVPTPFTFIAVAFLAFLTAGFSEVGGSFLAGVLVLLLVGLLAVKKVFKRELPKAVFQLIILALVCALIALLILFLSPANELRVVFYGERASLFQLLTLPFVFAFDLLRDTLRGLPVPLFMFSAFSGCLGVLAIRENKPERFSGKTLLIYLLSSALVCFLLVAVSLLPSVYIEQSLGEARIHLFARYLILLWLFAAVFAFSVFLWSRFKEIKPVLEGKIFYVVVFIMLLSAAYVLYSLGSVQNSMPLFEKRAAVWDERDAAIHQALDEDRASVDVRQIDSYAGVLELTDPPNWLNVCLSEAYGIDEVNSVLPWE